MSKHPEGCNVQTPGGSETAAEYFSTIQYSKKSLLQENSRSRLRADSSSKCLKQPFSGISGNAYSNLCTAHTAICAQFLQPVLYDSCVARFLTLVRALETAGMLMMIIVRIASVKI